MWQWYVKGRIQTMLSMIRMAPNNDVECSLQMSSS